MYSKEELTKTFEEYLSSLAFPGEPTSLYEPIIYSLGNGGKRLRPLLALMSCNLFCDDLSRALPCAAAVEVFHNFTLLHDDIMDNAAVRRGKPAVHRKWGTNSAILSGDAMMIYSYRLLEGTSPEVLPEIFRIFNDTALKVCEGQQYDMDFETLENVSMDEYMHMILLKTGVLLGGAAAIGAAVGGASAADRDRLYTFGTELGIAFQIRDDLLDSYGTEASLGKVIGGDILEGKKSFLTAAAMEAADDDTRMRLGGLMHNKEMLADTKISRVLAIYDSLDVRSRAERAILDHTAQATASLDGLSIPADRTARLRAMAAGLADRLK